MCSSRRASPTASAIACRRSPVRQIRNNTEDGVEVTYESDGALNRIRGESWHQLHSHPSRHRRGPQLPSAVHARPPCAEGRQAVQDRLSDVAAVLGRGRAHLRWHQLDRAGVHTQHRRPGATASSSRRASSSLPTPSACAAVTPSRPCRRPSASMEALRQAAEDSAGYPQVRRERRQRALASHEPHARLLRALDARGRARFRQGPPQDHRKATSYMVGDHLRTPPGCQEGAMRAHHALARTSTAACRPNSRATPSQLRR